jgi:hypothetical protein
MWLVVSGANDEIRPVRSKEHLEDSEGQDRNPQPRRTPRGQKSGVNGFRVWFDNPHHDYVECSCGWRRDLGSHYQMRTRYEPRE